MANWIWIADTALDPDAPVTSELMYALRDNPIALTEGAWGAPRLQRGAFNSSTASVSGTLNNGEQISVNIGEWAFFPSFTGSSEIYMRMGDGSPGPDSGRVGLYNSDTGASRGYSIQWRRLG